MPASPSRGRRWRSGLAPAASQLQALVDAMHEELLTHAVLHADETPVAMLKPGKGKTHKAYLWSYCTTAFDPVKAVVFDFAESRAGTARTRLPRHRHRHAEQRLARHARLRRLLGVQGWVRTWRDRGRLPRACTAQVPRTLGEPPERRRRAGTRILPQALRRRARCEGHDPRRATTRLRKERAEPIAKKFRDWLEAQRCRVPDGSATAKAIDYSRGRWIALTRYLDDGNLPCDNNWVENQIRPIAIGRSNWLFAGSPARWEARRSNQ